jgi:hypothetical protein
MDIPIYKERIISFFRDPKHIHPRRYRRSRFIPSKGRDSKVYGFLLKFKRSSKWEIQEASGLVKTYWDLSRWEILEAKVTYPDGGYIPL